MITNNFTAAMTQEELLTGEAHHEEGEQSRRSAMAAGLTKSSDELSRAWEQDSKLYITTLKGAIAAYEENKSLEEMLLGTVARLASVLGEGGGEVAERAMEIIKANMDGDAS